MRMLLMLLMLVSGQPDEQPYKLHTGEDNTCKDLFITFNLEHTQSVEFDLVDLLGRQITKKQWADVKDQTFQIELPELTNKVFIIRLHIDNKCYTNKIYLSK